ncbi:ATP-grasp domain-containing protein [Enterococcus sp. BWB1-3]|uniref:ATP-grasp domain-containing protein n=1 Tax=Enterococcus sp. BWB1-3 TaxID=2787713 RepID=UPI0019205900|nr:ATP-grasp domain-containing protein [Enterococcus sp. BWB1-3]MBL1230070.1 ATP-grasp domain-containing protein [Enterococcus sp. BWB1-3]
MIKTTLVINIKNPSRKSHFEKLFNMSRHFTLVMKEPTWEKRYFDNIIDVDTENLVDLISCLEKNTARFVYEGIFTLVEHAVPLTAILANYFDLKYISIETALKSRVKNMMRESFISFGIQCPKYGLAENIQQAKILGERLGYPLVLKPLIGGGSLSVMRMDNEKELAVFFDQLKVQAAKEFEYDILTPFITQKYNQAMILEQYIEGSEISVESIVAQHQTNIICIHDKRLPMEGPYFEEKLFSTPSELDGTIVEKVKSITKLANKSLGINMGATHTEFRIDAKGIPYIIEVGARIGGGPVYVSTLNSTGIDMVEKIVELATEGACTFPEKRLKNPVGFQHFFSQEKGILKKYVIPESIFENPNVIEFLPYIETGSSVLLPPNSVAHGHIIVKGKDILEIESTINEVEQGIKIILEE